MSQAQFEQFSEAQCLMFEMLTLDPIRVITPETYVLEYAPEFRKQWEQKLQESPESNKSE